MSAAVASQVVADFLKEAAQQVFETMAFMAVESGPVLEPTSGILQGEILSSLGFTGTASGLFVCSCPFALGRAITANMLGVEEAEIVEQAEVADAVGEITNMIAGNVKNRWVALGNRMDLSVPVVAMAPELQANLGIAGAGARIAFAVDDREEMITVEMRVEDHAQSS